MAGPPHPRWPACGGRVRVLNEINVDPVEQRLVVDLLANSKFVDCDEIRFSRRSYFRNV